MPAPTIGVLALQGDVDEHLQSLTRLGAVATAVRRPEELARIDGLILPGGESTTMIKLARIFELLGPLRDALRGGLPAFGTCAGMILLADRILDGAEGQETLGGLDVTVRRNAFGRQVDSFETDLAFADAGQVHAVFIRAPWVEEAGAGVEVLARVAPGAGVDDEAVGRIVAVQQGSMMATSFHPEVRSGTAGDDRIHRHFLDLVKSSQGRNR